MRQTNEQQDATAALRAQAGPYRVTLDAEGWPMIPGRYGRIEHHDGPSLAIYSESMRLLAKLVAAGARRHQIGDDEYRLLFERAALPTIAKVIVAQGGGRGRYTRAPGQMARLSARREATTGRASLLLATNSCHGALEQPAAIGTA